MNSILSIQHDLHKSMKLPLSGKLISSWEFSCGSSNWNYELPAIKSTMPSISKIQFDLLQSAVRFSWKKLRVYDIDVMN